MDDTISAPAIDVPSPPAMPTQSVAVDAGAAVPVAVDAGAAVPVAVAPIDPSAGGNDVITILKDQERRIETLETKFGELENEFAVDHSAASGVETIGAKVSKLFATIFGSDS